MINVTAKVSFQNPIAQVPQAPPPTFLFLYLQLSKNRQVNPVNVPNKAKTLKSQPRQSASANQGNSRAKVIVASSAAALVSDRAYRPAPFPQSTAIFKK
ncbi:hypothetical protein QN219_33495, partial [Sinorhizobium sp. 7-81]|uniref:hypothetical protein n=1 Tax=Sinorhizobium sp. 8-89 TaxID=3049089 RepID=UPI0024C22508